MNRRLKIVLIAIGGAFGGLVLLGLIVSIVAPEYTSDSESKPSLTATSTIASPPESPEPSEKREPAAKGQDEKSEPAEKEGPVKGEEETTPKPKPAGPPGTITRAGKDLDPWPFTVDSGVLACNRDAVTFTAGGTTYAVNGVAKGRGAKDIDPIWAEDKKAQAEWEEAGIDFEESGTSVPKINIGDAIEKGLKLCE